MEQEKPFCDSEAAFPYKVKVFQSGILTTLGGGAACLQLPEEARVLCSSLPKKLSVDRSVRKTQTSPAFLQVRGEPVLPASMAAFWIHFGCHGLRDTNMFLIVLL